VAWSRGVRPLRDGEVYPDLLAVDLRVGHCGPSLGGVLSLLEINESKSAGSATLAVQNDLDLLDGAELAKLLLQFPLRGVEAQAKHTKAVGRGGVVAVTSVSSPVRHG